VLLSQALHRKDVSKRLEEAVQALGKVEAQRAAEVAQMEVRYGSLLPPQHLSNTSCNTVHGDT
jgi:hypothetical protein